MAFDIDAFVKSKTQPVKKGGFDIDAFVRKQTGNYPQKPGTEVSGAFQMPASRNLKTSSGLYGVAVKNGLGPQADRILRSQMGEETKKFFSGGFISDTFDVLNALDYGVVGLLKGKSFKEGVLTRQSFSDQDAFGKDGIPGVIAGTLVDIAVDPLTYLGGFGILSKASKVMGLTKLTKATKAAIFGKMATKTIETAGETSKFADPLISEARKYKSAEEFVNKDTIAPEEYINLLKSKGETIDEFTKGFANREKIDAYRKLFKEGKTPPPLSFKLLSPEESAQYATSPKILQDGVHRAIAAYELGIKELPFRLKNTRSQLTDIWKKAQVADKTYQAIEGGTRAGKYFGSKFTWMFGADPIFKEAFERSVKNIAITTQAVSKLGKSVAELAPETAAKLLTKDETGRFKRTALSALKLTPAEIKPVAALYKYIDDLGKEAVDLGLLSQTKYEENIGTYIKNAYEEYELANKKGLFGFTRAGIKGIKKRVEGLTTGKMAELGQIDNPAYLLFKSAFDLTKDVENAKLFKTVAEKFGTDVAQEGFTKLPTGVRAGMAAGKYVPDNVALYLNEIIEPRRYLLAKAAVANFKFFKVVMNPGTHARNIVSNKILNYWKLGMNPLDPRVIKSDALAIAEIAKGGGKWSDEARPFGYDLDTFASAEMKNLLDSPEASAWGKGLGKAWPTIKKTLGDIYQAEENQAKLSAYIFSRTSRGLSPEEAWKAAESATFNYAQVTPFVRKLRESLFGFPFVTFTVKSTPLVVETILKNPQRVSVIGKIKQTIENLSDLEETDRERASEPAWVRNGFYIKLPMKDKEGRSAYFDLTYILPFGDIMSGNFFEGGTNRETGLPESKATTLAKKSPFISLVMEIGRNQDFYGNKIWKDSDPEYKKLGDLMRHLTKTYAPPLVGDLLPGGYNDAGEQQQRGILESLKPNETPDQKRTTMQELLRMVGAKIQPIDADIQETYQEWNKQKALRSLLLENGVLGEGSYNYLRD